MFEPPQPSKKVALGQFELDDLIIGKIIDDDEDGFIFREILDLKNKYSMCNLSQTINNPSMSLIISVADSSDLIEKMGTRGVQGEEWVYLRLSVPEIGDEIELLFVVTNIGPIKTLPNSKGHQFDLICQTKEQIINDTVTINKSYKNNMSTAAANIYHNDLCGSGNKIYTNFKSTMLGNTNIWKKRPFINHKTSGVEDFIIPGLQPFSAMNWLCKQAYGGAKYPSSLYTFFENNNGFHFASIEELIKENKKKAKVYTYLPLHSSTPKDDETYIRNIKSLGPITMASSSARMNDGTYAHDVRTIDIVMKKHVDRYFSMDTGFDMFEGTGNLFNNTTKYFNTFGQVDPFEYVTVKDGIKDRHQEETIGKRFAYTNLIGSFSTSITIYGDTSMNAGDVIDIQMPSATVETIEKDQLSMYGGLWFVTAVSHVFDHAQMTTAVEIQKSGLDFLHDPSKANNGE